jgi:hypothetical protein
MKKTLATVLVYVLGGVLGSSIYAADIPKPKNYVNEEKKIAVVDREAAFQTVMQQFYSELKAEMSRQSSKKQEGASKPAPNPQSPEKMGKLVLGLINGKLKDDEDKVAASVNANAVINNGRLENMVVSGSAGSASAVVNFDARTGRSTTNLSYADKKGSRVDVTLRDCKDPVVRLTTPLKFIKGVNFAGIFDSMTGYASANVSANYKRINASVNYENINNLGRTTASFRYSPPFKPIKFVSLTHVVYDGIKYYAFDALSRLGGFDFGVSARKIGNGKVRPSFVIRFEYKK